MLVQKTYGVAVLIIGFLFCVTVAWAQNFKVGYSEKGQASYYAQKFHGRTSASGERFSNYQYVGAHRKLPFNTRVKVTNLHNKKSVVIRIIDRGPFKRGRIVDLSRKAAVDVDMVSAGVIPVTMEVVSNSTTLGPIVGNSAPKPGNKTKPQPKPNEVDKKFRPIAAYSIWGTKKKPSGYGLQIGAYRDVDSAIKKGKKAMQKGLKEIYIQAGWANHRKIYRVIYGTYHTHEKALEDKKTLKKKGFKTFPTPHF